MTDHLNFGKKSVLREGYGIVAKLVMRDKTISPEAKAIYAYICSFAGSGSTAFPGADLMMSELKMGDKRFYKFRKELVDKGYITIIKQRNGNRREKNIYMINIEPVEHSQFESVQNESFQSESIQSESFQNEGGNINNYNKESSSSLKNKDIYDFYSKSGFGLLNQTLMEMLDVDIEMYGKEWVKDALTEAVRNGKYKLNYAEGILRNWKSNGRDKKEAKNNGSGREDLGTKLQDEGIGFNIDDV